MRIFRHFDTLPADCRGVSIALGNFDGFHRGHQQVIDAAREKADALDCPLAVFTTEPHPRKFFNPGLPPFLLTPFRSKAHYMDRFGVDVFFVAPFDEDFAATSAESFIRDLLAGTFAVRHVTVGYDYRFGRGRQGDISMLEEFGEKLDFGVSVIQPVGSGNDIYSSTLIREYLRDGQPKKAANLMGHWWTVEGHVLHGDRRGHTIGFPTANLSPDEYLIPALGVYAVRAHVRDGDASGDYDGVANVGRRPTFDKTEVVLEVHLFDFDGDLYGRHMEIEFIDYLRPEMKFDGLDALREQIARDAENAREVLADPENGPDRFEPLSGPIRTGRGD